MTAEQFCLRWNNHQSTLVSVFDGLFESGTLVDCTLAADGQYLKAHKVVLSACSPYLEALLSQHYNQHPILILKDVKFEELKAMLEYMYRGEVNVTQEQLGRFLKAAETLQIRGLTNSDVGQGAAQILSSATTAGAGDNSRDVVVKTRRREAAPTSWPRSPPLTGNEASLVETLKLTPSKLVIDIPPISPVNSIREEESSMSPQPRKRRRRNRSQNDDALSRGSGSAANSDSKSPAGVGGSAFDVEPVVMLDASAVKTEMESQQANDDDYYKEDDSEGELVMDEDFDTESKPGPSNGSSGIAECGPWHGITRDGDPESAKGSPTTRKRGELFGYLALVPKRGTKSPVKVRRRILRKRKLEEMKKKEGPASAGGDGPARAKSTSASSSSASSALSSSAGAALLASALAEKANKKVRFTAAKKAKPAGGGGGLKDISHNQAKWKKVLLKSPNGAKKKSPVALKSKVSVVIRKRGMVYGGKGRAGVKLNDGKDKGKKLKVKTPKKGKGGESKENVMRKEKKKKKQRDAIKNGKVKIVLKGRPPTKGAGSQQQSGADSPNGLAKNFLCSVCRKGYALKSSLLRHMNFECGKQPSFLCPYCDYAAHQKVHLQRHLERRHSGLPSEADS